MDTTAKAAGKVEEVYFAEVTNECGRRVLMTVVRFDSGVLFRQPGRLRLVGEDDGTIRLRYF